MGYRKPRSSSKWGIANNHQSSSSQIWYITLSPTMPIFLEFKLLMSLPLKIAWSALLSSKAGLLPSQLTAKQKLSIAKRLSLSPVILLKGAIP
jgi:hypothetical protein